MFHPTVSKRRSLAPDAVAFDPLECDTHAMRRRSGARRELSERVMLVTRSGANISGWALNIGRGGVRVIVESALNLAEEFEIHVGGETQAMHGRVVWLQEEPDGTIAGLEFTAVSGIHRSVPEGR